MKQIIRILIAGSVVWGIPAGALADPVTFDNVPCASIGGNHYASNCFAPEGVTISSFYQHGPSPLFTIKAAARCRNHPRSCCSAAAW